MIPVAVSRFIGFLREEIAKQPIGDVESFKETIASSSKKTEKMLQSFIAPGKEYLEKYANGKNLILPLPVIKKYLGEMLKIRCRSAEKIGNKILTERRATAVDEKILVGAYYEYATLIVPQASLSYNSLENLLKKCDDLTIVMDPFMKELEKVANSDPELFSAIVAVVAKKIIEEPINGIVIRQKKLLEIKQLNILKDDELEKFVAFAVHITGKEYDFNNDYSAMKRLCMDLENVRKSSSTKPFHEIIPMLLDVFAQHINEYYSLFFPGIEKNESLMKTHIKMRITELLKKSWYNRLFVELKEKTFLLRKPLFQRFEGLKDKDKREVLRLLAGILEINEFKDETAFTRCMIMISLCMQYFPEDKKEIILDNDYIFNNGKMEKIFPLNFNNEKVTGGDNRYEYSLPRILNGLVTDYNEKIISLMKKKEELVNSGNLKEPIYDLLMASIEWDKCATDLATRSYDKTYKSIIEEKPFLGTVLKPYFDIYEELQNIVFFGKHVMVKKEEIELLFENVLSKKRTKLQETIMGDSKINLTREQVNDFGKRIRNSDHKDTILFLAEKIKIRSNIISEFSFECDVLRELGYLSGRQIKSLEEAVDGIRTVQEYMQEINKNFEEPDVAEAVKTLVNYSIEYFSSTKRFMRYIKVVSKEKYFDSVTKFSETEVFPFILRVDLDRLKQLQSDIESDSDYKNEKEIVDKVINEIDFLFDSDKEKLSFASERIIEMIEHIECFCEEMIYETIRNNFIKIIEYVQDTSFFAFHNNLFCRSLWEKKPNKNIPIIIQQPDNVLVAMVQIVSGNENSKKLVAEMLAAGVIGFGVCLGKVDRSEASCFIIDGYKTVPVKVEKHFAEDGTCIPIVWVDCPYGEKENRSRLLRMVYEEVQSNTALERMIIQKINKGEVLRIDTVIITDKDCDFSSASDIPFEYDKWRDKEQKKLPDPAVIYTNESHHQTKQINSAVIKNIPDIIDFIIKCRCKGISCISIQQSTDYDRILFSEFFTAA
jgi:hypothetical protein